MRVHLELLDGVRHHTYYLPLTTYHLPLTTYYLPLTTYYLLLTTYYSYGKAAEAERGNGLAGLATKGSSDPSAARWRRWRHYAQQALP